VLEYLTKLINSLNYFRTIFLWAIGRSLWTIICTLLTFLSLDILQYSLLYIHIVKFDRTTIFILYYFQCPRDEIKIYILDTFISFIKQVSNTYTFYIQAEKTHICYLNEGHGDNACVDPKLFPTLLARRRVKIIIASSTLSWSLTVPHDIASPP